MALDEADEPKPAPGTKKPLARAIALGYDPEHDAAPRILAIGQGEIARQIMKLAEEHGITMVEDQPVVQALARFNPGQEIPVELYRAIAEILAFVYRLKERKGA